jgi:Cys-tRNA(Pro)/Cys-tRNA(Cys) deacylase
MTPAILKAKQSKIAYTVHEYEHDPSAESYGKEAAQKLGVDPSRVFKTLVVSGAGKDPAVAVVPVMQRLDLKLLAGALGTKKLTMAEVGLVQRVTGYVIGGVSPLGQKKRLRTVIDASAEEHETVFVSAGRRGLDIELSPKDLCALTNADFACIAR